jgi:hypothetical protein
VVEYHDPIAGGRQGRLVASGQTYSILTYSFSPRLLKKVQMQGGARRAE